MYHDNIIMVLFHFYSVVVIKYSDQQQFIGEWDFVSLQFQVHYIAAGKAQLVTSIVKTRKKGTHACFQLREADILGPKPRNGTDLRLSHATPTRHSRSSFTYILKAQPDQEVSQ